MGRAKVHPGNDVLRAQVRVMQVGELAAHYGVHVATVSKWLRACGIKDQRSANRKLTDDQVRHMRKTFEDLIESVPVSRGTVFDVICYQTYKDVIQ